MANSAENEPRRAVRFEKHKVDSVGRRHEVDIRGRVILRACIWFSSAREMLSQRRKRHKPADLTLYVLPHLPVLP